MKKFTRKVFESKTGQEIAEELTEILACGEDGWIAKDIDLADGRSAYIECELEIDGYREDDYFSGTGGFITTSVNCTIYRLEIYDEEGEEIDTDVDLREIEEYVEYELFA